MRAIPLGEGQRLFPSFFLSILSLFLGVGLCLLPLKTSAQKTQENQLSPFDRLAEEATLLNKRGQYDRVISLLEPHKKDKKNDSALFFNELGTAYSNREKFSDAVQAFLLPASSGSGLPAWPAHVHTGPGYKSRRCHGL